MHVDIFHGEIETCDHDVLVRKEDNNTIEEKIKDRCYCVKTTAVAAIIMETSDRTSF